MLIINNGKVFFKKKRVSLTKYEYKFFEFLIKNMKSSNYESLLDFVWGQRKCVVSYNTVSQLAYRLRVKLRASGIPLVIRISQKEGPCLKFDEKIIVLKKGDSMWSWRIKILK
jgi:DNA-binding response OmpR family regulator